MGVLAGCSRTVKGWPVSEAAAGLDVVKANGVVD